MKPDTLAPLAAFLLFGLTMPAMAVGAPPNDRWRPFGKAGLKPDGTYFSTGMEPWFAWGKNRSPGELDFYSYFVDMEPDRKMNK